MPYINSMVPQSTESKCRKGSPSFRKTGLSLSVAFVFVGLLICGPSIPVFADNPTSVSIYLYNSQGVLVNVTATTSYDSADGDVTNTATGALIGIVPSDYDPHIYAANGTIIGIISTSD